jgi:hypothetical protein
MMQPTHFWDFPDQSSLGTLDRPRHRAIHSQRPMGAPVMIILEVPGQEPSQMSLMQDDHVIQTLAADIPNHSFDIGVLPWTLRGDDHFVDPHVPHPLPKRGAVETVSVPQ